MESLLVMWKKKKKKKIKFVREDVKWEIIGLFICCK